MLGKTGFVLLLLHGLMVMLYDFVTEMSTFFRVVLQAVEASVGGLANYSSASLCRIPARVLTYA